ncbi:MAG: DUF6732 family protein [Roseibium sp.]
MTNRIILSALLTVYSPAMAFAHGGHLGDLAGHSHWVGVAALAGAALVAGVAAWANGKNKDASESDEDAAVDAEKPDSEAVQ